MINAIVMLLLYWLSLFFWGYVISTVDKRAVLLAVLFYIGGLVMYFYQLVIGSMGLPSSLPSSIETGIMGLFLVLFLGSSLGSGYIVGRLVKKK